MQNILVLLSFIGKFFTSETGAVRQSTSLPLAWAAAVLAAAATLLGATIAQAEANCGVLICAGVQHADCCLGPGCWISQYCECGIS
jgi:hypothetical protein